VGAGSGLAQRCSEVRKEGERAVERTVAPPIMVVALVVVARAILTDADTTEPLANAARDAFSELRATAPSVAPIRQQTVYDGALRQSDLAGRAQHASTLCMPVGTLNPRAEPIELLGHHSGGSQASGEHNSVRTTAGVNMSVSTRWSRHRLVHPTRRPCDAFKTQLATCHAISRRCPC
jgi:hypothetical protein